ncbi:hypothetical protein BDQ17DRAFT_1431976 [Cyathus striatus]|nr:hypothetical protein BDQ17DRAFT_1431976 [Cyathus striatus]
MSELAGPSISLINSSNIQSSELQQLEERLALVKAGKRSKASKCKDHDADKENEGLHVVGGKRKGVKCKNGIQWSDSTYFDLTDLLLTKIRRTFQMIECDFKWYKRLHSLLSSSPIYSHSGVANSSSPLDLSILEPQALDNNEANGSSRMEQPTVMDKSSTQVDEEPEDDEERMYLMYLGPQ